MIKGFYDLRSARLLVASCTTEHVASKHALDTCLKQLNPQRDEFHLLPLLKHTITRIESLTVGPLFLLGNRCSIRHFLSRNVI